VEVTDNKEKLKITYHKFKNGEATVRYRRVKQKFGKFIIIEIIKIIYGVR
jgi:hypothetical protein